MKKLASAVTVLLLICSTLSAGENDFRTAHYIVSTHWDREWYEPFQGFRMRLVSLLDEVFETFEKNPEFRSFTMDGQVVPIYDYLEIRPEKRPLVERFVREGRLVLGPWYVQADEWLACGELIVRNLQMGRKLAAELGASATRAGLICDQFGHVGQMPQILDQMGMAAAFAWRGVPVGVDTALFNWKAPDGTLIPAYRFGTSGYSTYAFEVREANTDRKFDLQRAVGLLVDHTLAEAHRSLAGPILLFDGGDHMEIEPATSELLARANEILESKSIRIVHSDPDSYVQDLLKYRAQIVKTVVGEMRRSRRTVNEGHLIPGVLSSRIQLKQQNALCEDELCLWAEPFSTFAALYLGEDYPSGYLHTAWKHLLKNHPHDSMCTCSIDQVHQDMIFRFDQSLGISSRLTARALKQLALAAAPEEMPDGSILLAVFNATGEDIDEPVDLDIPLPSDWPSRFQEFFGYEGKFSFKLIAASGREIPYPLVAQRPGRQGFWRQRKHFPRGDMRHVVSVSTPLRVPSFGYTTLIVEPADGPTRYSGSMRVSHRGIENEFLKVQAESNGTITVTDKRTGRKYEQLLTFENRADIGDGWFHGLAVNDQVHFSTAGTAEVAIVADGFAKATLRISLEMNLPKEFDFRTMRRSEQTAALKIVSDVTLRQGSDRIEVRTTVENNLLDHRLRVLFPTGLTGETYLSNSAFDVVERRVALPQDNDIRSELEVETRPQITWTAFGDSRSGLAVVSRGLPESSVIDTPGRPIALTLLRAFRRAVYSNDNPGGQIQGMHTFSYDIVPVAGEIPVNRLYVLGQRVNVAVRIVDLLPKDLELATRKGTLPREHSFLETSGGAVFTSIQRHINGSLFVRLFNPHATSRKVTLNPANVPNSARCITLDGRDDTKSVARLTGGTIEISLPPKRISTVLIE